MVRPEHPARESIPMIRRRFCLCIVCAVSAAVLALLVLGSTQTAGAAEPAGKPVSFLADVAPILKESCFACHDARKRSGKYDMTTFEKLMAGGTNGESIAAGKPGESEFHALMVAGDDRRMPPKDKGEAVSKAKAAVVGRWIAEGAKPDGGLDPRADLVRELRRRWVPPMPPEKYPFPKAINALAFASDGSSLVAGGHHELTVWSLPDGKLTKRVRTRAKWTYAMAFLPNGLLAVAGGRPGQEGDVRVYDLTAPGETLDGVNDPAVLKKHLFDADDSVLCLAVSPDGSKLAAGGCDRVIRVWNMAGGIEAAEQIQSVESHTDWILGLAFSPDGRFLASASRDKSVKVWDVQAGESILSFPEHTGPVFGVAFADGGKTAYSAGFDKVLRSWKPDGDGKQLKSVGAHKEAIVALTADPKGETLATASTDGTVRLWKPEPLAEQRVLKGLNDSVNSVAFSLDGSRIAAGASGGQVRVWQVSDGREVAAFTAAPGLNEREASDVNRD